MKKTRNFILLILLVFGLTAVGVHRFYVAIYKINYRPQKKRVEITARIFVDDLNEALLKDFHKKTFLGTDKETPESIELMKKYLAEKFKVSINGKNKSMIYLSNEIENNIIVCYLVIKDISKVNTIDVENSVLVELYPEQQNIIQFSNNNAKSNLLLTSKTTKGMLK